MSSRYNKPRDARPIYVDKPRVKSVNSKYKNKQRFNPKNLLNEHSSVSLEDTHITSHAITNDKAITGTRVGVIPVTVKDGEVSLLLGYDRSHDGKKTFKMTDFGGKSDPTDKNSWHGALRELQEETAIKDDVMSFDFIQDHMNRKNIIEVRIDFVRPKPHPKGRTRNVQMYLYFVIVDDELRDRILRTSNDEIHKVEEFALDACTYLLSRKPVYGWDSVDKPHLTYSIHKALSLVEDDLALLSEQ
jgi:8-oxo-dGTP pyrophosphatase MutT (NUDIX family)